MNEVSVFTFRKMPVRVVLIKDQNYFVIRDICNILGFSNPNRELAKYTENVPLYERIRTPGGLQVVRLVPRSDVEKLLSANTGRKALLLDRWLKAEVFPKFEADERSTAEARNLLTGYLNFMKELMSVPLDRQPAVIFSLPDIPFRLEVQKVSSGHDR